VKNMVGEEHDSFGRGHSASIASIAFVTMAIYQNVFVGRCAGDVSASYMMVFAGTWFAHFSRTNYFEDTTHTMHNSENGSTTFTTGARISPPADKNTSSASTKTTPEHQNLLYSVHLLA
jgi:hypothetical protein